MQMINEEVLVSVEGVSKKFSRNYKKSLWYGLIDTIRKIFGIKANKALRKSEFWAVRNISFTLNRRDCIGLIGHNGAGKSTLLKMLNGLIPPDEGRIEMRGRVNALIELGAGFDPILTGRENIYNNGSVLGFSKKEIDDKLDAIIEFSEIGDFIDSPVQNYSSGMKVRLGFAVAAQMEPDILIIDEVLAVGDIGFVLKCLNRIDSLLKNAAIIFVSHSMPQVARICTELLLMKNGRTIFQSTDVSEGIDQYYSQFKIQHTTFADTNIISIKSFLINGQVTEQEELLKINRLDDLILEIGLDIPEQYQNPHLSVAFFDKEMRNVAQIIRDESMPEIVNINGNILIKLTIPEIQFSKGIYSITLTLSDKMGGRILFRQQSIAYFQVIAEHHVWSAFQLKAFLEQLN